MSLLTLAQTVFQRIGLTTPNAVATSSDAQVLQLMALINEEGRKLSTGESVGRPVDWTALQSEATWTATATEDQGAIATIAPGLRFIINGTIFNRTLRRPVPGPLGPQSWQLLKAANVTGPYPQWRVRGGRLIMTPVPNAGDSIYFEYQSSYWAQSSGGTSKAAFTLDDDVSLLDEELLIQGALWRWKKAKGLEYEQDFAEYKVSVLNAISRDMGKPTLDMGAPQYRTGVILVPQSPGITPIP